MLWTEEYSGRTESCGLSFGLFYFCEISIFYPFFVHCISYRITYLLIYLSLSRGFSKNCSFEDSHNL